MYTEVSLFDRLYLYNTETTKSSLIFPESRETPDLLGRQRCGSFSPDGSKICYIRRMDPTIDWELFVVDFNDGKLNTNDSNYGTQLTFNGGVKHHTDWSPDGKWITYRQGEREGIGGDIWIVPSEGGDPINLTRSLKTKRIMAGYAVLDVSMDSLNRAIAEGNYIALIITTIMIVIGAVFAIVLVRNVVHHVDNLEKAVSKVADGDLDQKVSIQRGDEIGSLAQSFNRMTHQLKTALEDTKSRNRELEKAYKELKTLDKAKDDFLSLVSHEIRTPLSSILASSEMLMKGLIKSDETKADFHTTIVNECKRLTRLINDVLDLSKIEAGRMTFNQKALNIRELIDEMQKNIDPILTAKGIRFECEQIPSNASLLGDKDKVLQVLENIISNAIKYTPQGSTISVSVTKSNGIGTIAIKDTGKGIPEEYIPRVFDRFTQLENVDHHSEGAGLGMAISKSIIEGLGGKIWIESELEVGTTVYFTLPLIKSSITTKRHTTL